MSTVKFKNSYYFLPRKFMSPSQVNFKSLRDGVVGKVKECFFIQGFFPLFTNLVAIREPRLLLAILGFNGM